MNWLESGMLPSAQTHSNFRVLWRIGRQYLAIAMEGEGTAYRVAAVCLGRSLANRGTLIALSQAPRV